MKIKYEETITNVYDENNELIETYTVKTPILVPEEGELIKNKITGELSEGIVGVGTMDSVDNYEAVVVEKKQNNEVINETIAIENIEP